MLYCAQIIVHFVHKRSCYLQFGGLGGSGADEHIIISIDIVCFCDAQPDNKKLCAIQNMHFFAAAGWNTHREGDRRRKACQRITVQGAIFMS